MIPKDMEEDRVGSLEDELAESLEEDFDSESMNVLREDYLYRVPFDSAFASLGDFRDICALLKGKVLSDVMAKIADGMLEKEIAAGAAEENQRSPEDMKDIVSRLHDIATSEITAEGSASSNMLATTSIREIVREFRDTVPQLVVLGAKGSGKTYIYKQLLSRKNWENFSYGVEPAGEKDRERTLILPLVCSLNIKMLLSMVRECIESCNHTFEEVDIKPDIIDRNYTKLASYAEKETSLTEWMEIWQRLMLDMLGAGYSDISELDRYLENKGKRILFIVDGLEDLFMDLQVQKQKTWRFAIRALCQNIVNTLRNLQFGNVGIVVFARKDMAEEAIEINFDQFQNQYHKYELKWSPSEALRLALWIAKQADPALGEGVDILKASREVLEERLEKLWGKKLGRYDSREANSARWIIAALSDFSNQLQARDIEGSCNLPPERFRRGNRLMKTDISCQSRSGRPFRTVPEKSIKKSEMR